MAHKITITSCPSQASAGQKFDVDVEAEGYEEGMIIVVTLSTEHPSNMPRCIAISITENGRGGGTYRDARLDSRGTAVLTASSDAGGAPDTATVEVI